MLKTTTPSVEGREIAAYLDIVVGEAILGSNFFKDMLGSIRDVVGGRSGAYEREMRKARETAFAQQVKTLQSKLQAASIFKGRIYQVSQNTISPLQKKRSDFVKPKTTTTTSPPVLVPPAPRP